jgi:peptidoglycan/xylan/chitin deacetylase (PgdA/CDA1 family)
MIARRAFSVLLLISLSIAANAATHRDTADPSGATILCYHIVEGPSAPRMLVTRDAFRQHLRYLEMTGYTVIPLRHVYEYATGKRASLPRNAVVLTFDDGWRSTYTEAFPELQKRGFPFTVFIYPNIIGQTSNALSWKQIREMAEAGVDIQSHSLTHPYLTRRHHTSQSEAEYVAWLQRELVESKKILEKHIGKTVSFLAYPYGDYDTRLARAVQDAGYQGALTCDYGRVRRGADPLRLKRVAVDQRMDFASFRHYLGANPMELADVTPTPSQPVDPGVTMISAKIPNYQSLDPKSVGMALLSLGSPVPYAYDASNGEISLALESAISNLKTRFHRAIVWGTDMKTGKRVEATFLLRMPAPPQPATADVPIARVAPAAAARVATAAHAGGK